MDTELKIDVQRMSQEGEELSGALDDAIYGIKDEFLTPFGGLRYELGAMLLGNELLVRGKLEQDFTAACSRCGEDFDFTVKVTDFTTSFEVNESTKYVELTDELRESVLLEVPNYPVCREDCPGITEEAKKDEASGDSCWDVLDGLKKKG